jgi:vancomycin resistance protein YoaR
LLGLSATAATAYYSLCGDSVADGVRVWGKPAGGLTRKELTARLCKQSKAFLSQPIALKAAGRSYEATWEELGVEVDVEKAVDAAMRVGHSSSLWKSLLERRRAQKGAFHIRPVISIDRSKTESFMKTMKEKVDRRPERGRINLRNRKVLPGKVGYKLKVHKSAAEVMLAARTGRSSVELDVETIQPALSAELAAKLDIATVLGWYETSFKSTGRYEHRAHNLQVAARKLNGRVIMPGELFSFNQALGPRTRQEGYRVAPVISAGEKVDGMAGGTCQISSTLHAAAYFAGLDIVEAEVHSQPSHYIELGLDATVVWPDTDLKLRNPYDFPLVIHFEVAFGRVRTEILGKKRHYEIGFERRIVRQRPYKEVTRQDPELLVGKRKIEQRGEFGYAVRRRRVFFDKSGNEIKAQYWTLIYPPTTLIIRVGTKVPEDPTLIEEPKEFPPIPPKPTPQKFVRIKQ